MLNHLSESQNDHHNNNGDGAYDIYSLDGDVYGNHSLDERAYDSRSLRGAGHDAFGNRSHHGDDFYGNHNRGDDDVCDMHSRGGDCHGDAYGNHSHHGDDGVYGNYIHGEPAYDNCSLRGAGHDVYGKRSHHGDDFYDNHSYYVDVLDSRSHPDGAYYNHRSGNYCVDSYFFLP